MQTKEKEREREDKSMETKGRKVVRKVLKPYFDEIETYMIVNEDDEVVAIVEDDYVYPDAVEYKNMRYKVEPITDELFDEILDAKKFQRIRLLLSEDELRKEKNQEFMRKLDNEIRNFINEKRIWEKLQAIFAE